MQELLAAKFKTDELAQEFCHTFSKILEELKAEEATGKKIKVLKYDRHSVCFLRQVVLNVCSCISTDIICRRSLFGMQDQMGLYYKGSFFI